MADKKTPSSLLDDMKKLEEAKKKRVLAKILTTIKQDAENILRLKVAFDMYMEELGVEKKEAKRIIDWINSLIKVSEKEKEELRETVRNELKEEKEEAEKKISDDPSKYLTALTTAVSDGSLTNATLSNKAYVGDVNAFKTTCASIGGQAGATFSCSDTGINVS